MPLLIADVDRNADANACVSRITHFSLHTTTPGITGAAEAVGGTPAYARKVPSFNAAGAVGPLGATLQPATVGIAWSNTMTFDVPAGGYTYWGAWGTAVYLRGNVLSTAQNPTSQQQINFAVGIGPYSGA